MSGVDSAPDKLPQIDKKAYDAQIHFPGEGYSGKNKVPTVSAFLARQQAMTEDHSAEVDKLRASRAQQSQAEQAKRDREGGSAADVSDGAKTDAAAQGKSAGQLEKEEMMKKARANHQPNAQDFEAQGEREVFDPVTHKMVVIRDAKLEDFQNPKLFDPQNLDPSNLGTGGPSTNPPSSGGASIKHTTPLPVEPSNINFFPYPPPVDQNGLKAITRTINSYALAILGGLGVIWFFTAWRAGWAAFLFRSQVIGAVALCVFFAHGIVVRKIEKELERIRLEMHKQRGMKFSPPTPESVEWLNAFTKVIWPLINPDMFTSIVDMIEDTLQASLPGFVDAVKIEDMTIGKNAFRILNMRALPDQPTDPDYPKEEWIDQGDREAALDPNRRIKKEKKKEEESDEVMKQENPEDEDQTGDYVNYEISFAYFAPPGKEKLHGENISLIIKFFLGMHDLFHLPVPIWIAVESIVGTIRLRCQMVAQAPFIRNVTFTLMGVPAIEASAIPLSRALPNVLDLPLISGFVKSAIAAASSIYVAPKSMTMNIAQMLAGDGVKRDTSALGVFQITIHHGAGLSAQDDNGSSDPYVVIAYSKFGKPLFSTRIIREDLNPVWEQTAFILVSADEVRAAENLSIQLWDSDRVSADDLVGRIQVPITELMLKPNEMQHRTDKLMGFEDADEMSGTLTWSVAYYEKAKLNPDLKKEPGIDHSLPKELQDHPQLKIEENKQDTPEEADVERTPPDPQYPSGILSVIINQIHSLERQNLTGASGKNREGQAGQDTDEASEQNGNLPSSYCEIVVNDDLCYRTRVKQYTQMPFFSAGTEMFVRDYTKTSLRIVVRDARLREHDPILGIVDLPLQKTLAHSSQVTRMYSLQGGVGWGKVSVSILFKGVQMSLPKELSGWETGTVEIKGPIKVEAVAGADFDWREKKLVLSTSEASTKISARAANSNGDGALEWDIDHDIRLPVYDRYSSALYLDYGGSSVKVGPLGSKRDAFAALWLAELIDDEPKEVRLPVIVAKSPAVRFNYINDQCQKTHDYEIVGYLTTTVVLDSGLDADHEKYATTQTARHEFEQYDRVEGQAAQAETNAHANDDGVIDKEEQKQIDRAHKKALESRHRGKMQFRPYRTAVWAKDGLKDRARGLKDKLTGGGKKEETIATEGA
ncbi:hypothetical protein NBRC10512_007335 [Rhodotorula toruloides]|uniref:RHTO0S01e11188g1_1 n=2 Tax=Rhodotorula toruloides TaxID=5286 RepID=A0A061AEP4_RHOTO|nr:C2 domain protein [Rhodotorula toruloides NP11]EMS24580.1 C2 domain protein [Rhodotorula toruloides NP11]CDR35967.1 RHTO0S01e11188g1_1 [Rhodotorula toruloides]